MMKICYIILAHERLKYVKRLIAMLSGNDTSFVIHIDKKCQEDISILSDLEGTTLVDNRVDVKWGDISQVDATISASRAALATKAEYFILLSGSDYPVKTPGYIRQYLSQDPRNHIGGVPLPSNQCNWLQHGYRRIGCYALRLNSKNIATIEPRKLDIQNLRQLAKVVIRWKHLLKALRILTHYPKRPPCPKLTPHGGEYWWRLNRESLERCIAYLDQNPDFHSWLLDSANPDELCFNTLAYNLCDNNDGNILTHISWNATSSMPGGGVNRLIS